MSLYAAPLDWNDPSDAIYKRYIACDSKAGSLCNFNQVLKYAPDCTSAAECGSVDILRAIHKSGGRWNERTCEAAAGRGHLGCLKYAHENGCPWSSGTCAAAARWGSLACLKYAHENGCPWNEATCAAAAERGSLECLKYAHENGCPWDERCLCCKSLDCALYAYDHFCPATPKVAYSVLDLRPTFWRMVTAHQRGLRSGRFRKAHARLVCAVHDALSNVPSDIGWVVLGKLLPPVP